MKARDLFHSTAQKLTIYYLAIIFVISLIFSLTLYQIAAGSLRHSILRPGQYDQLLLSEGLTYQQYKDKQLAESLSNLRANLIFFNLAVLIFGGVASYWLARQTLRPIEDALEAQSRFTADASHELRTPLTVMQTENEVILRNDSLTKAEAVGQLKSNLEEVAKLKALSEGLLVLASSDGSIGSGQKVSVEAVVARAIDQVAKAAKAKRIKISSFLKNLSIRGHADQLAQLVAVLLDNAIKYSPSGSQLKVSITKHAKEVLISVSDQGPGIRSTDLPHIFERFYQADSSRSKNKIGGWGLGLAIAKKIADRHDGSIEVRSTLGQGATFIVHLPAYPKASSALAKDRSG